MAEHDRLMDDEQRMPNTSEEVIGKVDDDSDDDLDDVDDADDDADEDEADVE